MIKQRPKKRYTAIAKIGYDQTLKNNICVLYRFNNIDNFLKFMQKNTSLYGSTFIISQAIRLVSLPIRGENLKDYKTLIKT